MRRAKYIVMLALAATPAVVVLAVGRTQPPRTSQAAPQSPRHWEYRVMAETELANATETVLANYAEPNADGAAVVAIKQRETRLNELGMQGWELVAVGDHTMIFRRNAN